MAVFLGLLGPVLGLFGVVLGLWVGERRARLQLEKESTKFFEEQHKGAYSELWDQVQDTYLEVRHSLYGDHNFVESLAGLNEFMIRKGLYIERNDRFLVMEYLYWSNEFVRILSETPGGADLLELSISHEDLPDQIDALGKASKRSNELRSELRSRIRDVLGASSEDGSSAEGKTPEEIRTLLGMFVMRDSLEDGVNTPKATRAQPLSEHKRDKGEVVEEIRTTPEIEESQDWDRI